VNLKTQQNGATLFTKHINQTSLLFKPTNIHFFIIPIIQCSCCTQKLLLQ